MNTGVQYGARWDVQRHKSTRYGGICRNEEGSAACKGQAQRAGTGEYEIEAGFG